MGYRPFWSKDAFTLSPCRLQGPRTTKIYSLALKNITKKNSQAPNESKSTTSANDDNNNQNHHPSSASMDLHTICISEPGLVRQILKFSCTCPMDVARVAFCCKAMFVVAIQSQEEVVSQVDVGTRMVLDQVAKETVGRKRLLSSSSSPIHGLDGEFAVTNDNDGNKETDDDDDDDDPLWKARKTRQAYLRALQHECYKELAKLWTRPRFQRMLSNAARKREKDNGACLQNMYPITYPPNDWRDNHDGKLFSVAPFDWKELDFYIHRHAEIAQVCRRTQKEQTTKTIQVLPPVQITFQGFQDHDLAFPHWLVYIANRIGLPRGYVMNGECCLIEDYGGYGICRMVNSELKLFCRDEFDDDSMGGYNGVNFLCGNMPGYLEYLSNQGLVPLYPCIYPNISCCAQACRMAGTISPGAIYTYLEEQWDEKQSLYRDQLKRIMCTKYASLVRRNPHLKLGPYLARVEREQEEQESSKKRKPDG